MGRILIIMAAFMMLLAGSATSQIMEPVTWKFELKEVNQYEVQILAYAAVDNGWKVYGLNVPEGGPVATELTFEEAEGYRPLKNAVELIKPVVKHDEVFDMEVPFFKHEATFAQNVRITQRPVKIKGYVTFMCCNDETCLPPTDVEFELEVPEK